MLPAAMLVCSTNQIGQALGVVLDAPPEHRHRTGSAENPAPRKNARQDARTGPRVAQPIREVTLAHSLA
jgi:hypothetical protein